MAHNTGSCDSLNIFNGVDHGGLPMRRREFITLISGAAATWPFAVHAQRSKPVIGFLRLTTPDESGYLLTALRKGLNEAGYVEGDDLVINIAGEVVMTISCGI